MAPRQDAVSLFAQRDHAHLRLAAVLTPQPRRKLPPGGGSRGPAKDHGTHAKRIQDQIQTILERHRHRTAVFGISPDLVVVVEFRVPAVSLADQLEQAGLQVLAATGMKAMAAFAADPEMAEFLRRNEQYSHGVPPDQKTAHYERLFDAIDNIRPLEPADVVDSEVQLTDQFAVHHADPHVAAIGHPRGTTVVGHHLAHQQLPAPRRKILTNRVQQGLRIKLHSHRHHPTALPHTVPTDLPVSSAIPRDASRRGTREDPACGKRGCHGEQRRNQ